AAVHLFAIISNYQFAADPSLFDIRSSTGYGDIDIVGIYLILSAAAIMLAPILKWSTSIRKLRAQAVVVYWGMLIFAALVPALYFFQAKLILNYLPSFALCQNTAEPKCRANLAVDFANLSFEFYTRC